MDTPEEELATVLATRSDPFASTRWTLVMGAQKGSESALNELVSAYREPIVRHLTRKLGANDGEDAAQEYLRGFLESGYLREASQKRGKFRAFLLHDLRYFILGWRRFHSAKKRGGGMEKSSYESAVEAGVQMEAPGEGRSDEEFDQDWTRCLMLRARDGIKKLYQSRGNGDRFEVLGRFIELGGDAAGYEAAAAELDMEPGAVKMAVSRLRKAFAQILRDLVAESISEDESVDEELEYLKRCFLKSLRSGGEGGLEEK